MKTIELGWVVGLFEGEGCFSIRRYHNGRNHFSMVIQMTDEDVILKFHKLVRVGRTAGPYQKRDGNKPVWSWAVNGPLAHALAYQFRPFLSSRRKEQLARAIRETTNPPLAERKRDSLGRYLPVVNIP